MHMLIYANMPYCIHVHKVLFKSEKMKYKKQKLLTSLMPPAELGGTEDSSSVTLLPESYSA